MKNTLTSPVAITAFLLLLLATLTAQATTFTGKVVGVSDGDTITVLAAGNRQFKIRLLAIDTPESGQAFGDKAKQALSKKVFGQFVQNHWTKQDQYERVQLNNGLLGVKNRLSECSKVSGGWEPYAVMGDESHLHSFTGVARHTGRQWVLGCFYKNLTRQQVLAL